MHAQAHTQLYLCISVYIDKQSGSALLALLIIFLQKRVKTTSQEPFIPQPRKIEYGTPINGL